MSDGAHRPAWLPNRATWHCLASCLDRRPTERLTEAIRRYPDWNVHALLVERAGRLVYEEYFIGQQRIYVLPDGRLVVTVLAGRYDDMTASGLPMRFLLEYIIPAVRGEGAKAGMLGG